MSTSRGFGKLNAQAKEKVALRKTLREIHSLVRREKPKDTLPECKQTEENCPEDFEPKHWYEWVRDSAIDPEVTSLNLKSLSGSSAYSYLLYSPNLSRTNTGRLSSGILRNYQHLDDGGWWCSGIDILTSQDSLWGCLKPNSPKWDEEKGKHRKYEHPAKVASEVFALKVPPKVWQLVSRRYQVEPPENYQELPHGCFWQWVRQHPQIPIIPCEGAKKAAAILSCGYVAVGLPGVWNGVRQPKDEDGNYDGLASLIPQLGIFAQPGRRVYFCFDQDSKRQSARSVSKAIAKTAKLFLIQGCEVRVITWHPGLGKGIDDVCVAFGREKFDELYRLALTSDQWFSQQLRALTYNPDKLINERYIGEILPPHNAQLIAVKAPKGCGKTEWLRWLVAPQVSSGERKTLLITHRVQLGLQTTDRLEIPFANQLKDTEQGSLFGYGLCVDSLHPQSQVRFNPQEWRGAWVIIDEIQQVIWHLLSSITCQKTRVVIIKNLQELLRTVIATGGKIIIADADLNDIAIDFVEGLLGFSPERFILVNEFKFTQPWTIYKFGGKTPAGLVAEVQNCLQAGQKIMLCVSGQKVRSKWGTQNLEEYFRIRFPVHQILRIDSESVANPKHEAYGCTSNLNKIIVDYDLVISSPTIETGVSIDVQHFDGVFYIGQGTQTCDGVRQNLARVRPPVPRYIWLKSNGIQFIGNRATTPEGLIASQKKLDKANRSKLVEAGLQELPEGNFSPTCLQAWAELGAIINTGMWKFEANIIVDLEEEGHTVLDWKGKQKESEETEDKEQEETTSSTVSPDTVQTDVTLLRDKLYQEYRENVATARSVSDTEYEKLNKQSQRDTDELLQLRKGQVERKYLVNVTPELVEKDDEKWGAKLRLHYFWSDYKGMARTLLKFTDKQSMERAITDGKGDYFIPDNNKILLQPKIAALDYLGIDRLYNDFGFHNDHPVVKDIVNRITSNNNLYHIKTVLGCDLSKASKNPEKRIEILQNLLGLIGHKMVCYHRKGKRGSQIRYYSSPAPEFEREEGTKKLVPSGSFTPLSDGREQIFEAWFKRDTELRYKSQVQEISAKQRAADENIQFIIQLLEECKTTEQLANIKSTYQQDFQKAKELLSLEGRYLIELLEEEKELEERGEWLSNESLKDLADILESCESSEELGAVCEFTPAYAMKEAAKLLSVQKRAEIKQWVIAQNA